MVNNENHLYSAIWLDGPLYWNNKYKEFLRNSNELVALKYLDPNTKEYIIVIENKYCEKCGEIYTNILHEWCNTCQIDYFIDWTSGNEIIDNFIQNMQLKVDSSLHILFEWIPYNQFKDINQSNFIKTYSAIWNDGPLYYNLNDEMIDKEIKEMGELYVRDSYKKVALKYISNSQNISHDYLDKVLKDFSIKRLENNVLLYGLTQNPITKDYFMVLDGEYFRYIRESDKSVTLKYLNNSRNVSKKCLNKNQDFARNSNEKVALKYLGNSQNIIDNLNEILKEYSLKGLKLNIYGVSKNPITKDYIMILDKKYFEIYCIKCEKIYTDISYRWCRPYEACIYGVMPYMAPEVLRGKPYTQAADIYSFAAHKNDALPQKAQISKPVSNAPPVNLIVFLANAGNGGRESFRILTLKPVYVQEDEFNSHVNSKLFHHRDRYWNKRIVVLKCLDNEVFDSEVFDSKEFDSEEFDSKEFSNKFLNKVLKEYTIKEYSIRMIYYGVSQDPITKDYLLVLDDYLTTICIECGERYTNKYDECVYKEYVKNSDEVVVLEYFDSKELALIKVLEEYSIKTSYDNKKIYGISQNPITKDYLLVLNNKYLRKYCVNCVEQCTVGMEKLIILFEKCY
ncbi:kinase-like domain-containing protein [Rhizophagus irregularis DAOM 181602=DAOM 197198]|nr:kinase-like domain-containing protein [Rhizophagus irregularis DAOM 181602=DAOM 197198]